MSTQANLFDGEETVASIEGLVYQPEFLTEIEEHELIEIIRTLPLHAAQYKQYEARRRVVSFGGSFDFDTNTLQPTSDLDDRLRPLRRRIAQWLGIPDEDLVHALVSEYLPGTPLGWHRDVPNFEVICGVSLGGLGTMRFRPYPYEPTMESKVVQLTLEPRSIYKIAGVARWGWQHAVSPTRASRWSITFRTAAARSDDRLREVLIPPPRSPAHICQIGRKSDAALP